jgi:hypothetical protein
MFDNEDEETFDAELVHETFDVEYELVDDILAELALDGDYILD